MSEERDRPCIGIAGTDMLVDGGEKEGTRLVGDAGDKGRERGRRIVEPLVDIIEGEPGRDPGRAEVGEDNEPLVLFSRELDVA